MTSPLTPPALAPTFDARQLRQTLGRFATGVTIVTCVDEAGQRIGLTANSFNALSLDPPLVLWSLRQASPSVAAFREAGHFAINVLAESQVELSRRFASPVADKFAEGVWSAGQGGAPVLTAAGDHVLFIGRVLALADIATPPLLFHGGHYHLLGEIL